MSSRQLTAGEECQNAARQLSAFTNRTTTHIPPLLFADCYGIAILRGPIGVSLVRLPSGDWSAPLAIRIHTNTANAIQPLQETVLLFMTDASCSALVAKSSAIFGQTLHFRPGPFGSAPYDRGVDVFAYVRFNQGFTPSDLVMSHMDGWSICQDELRHEIWHGQNVTWYDVISNKISVDRSSVGNALYVVLNMAGAGMPTTNARNYAKLSEPAPAPPKPVRSGSHSVATFAMTAAAAPMITPAYQAPPGHGVMPGYTAGPSMPPDAYGGGAYPSMQGVAETSGYASQANYGGASASITGLGYAAPPPPSSGSWTTGTQGYAPTPPPQTQSYAPSASYQGTGLGLTQAEFDPYTGFGGWNGGGGMLQGPSTGLAGYPAATSTTGYATGYAPSPMQQQQQQGYGTPQAGYPIQPGYGQGAPPLQQPGYPQQQQQQQQQAYPYGQYPSHSPYPYS